VALIDYGKKGFEEVQKMQADEKKRNEERLAAEEKK